MVLGEKSLESDDIESRFGIFKRAKSFFLIEFLAPLIRLPSDPAFRMGKNSDEEDSMVGGISIMSDLGLSDDSIFKDWKSPEGLLDNFAWNVALSPSKSSSELVSTCLNIK